jgi:hypothetical protein
MNNNIEQENKDLLNLYKEISKSDSLLKERESSENQYDYLSNLFLYLLSHLQNSFYDKYEKDFYEIYADIVSFIKNPNCSCRSKIVNYVKINREQVQKIILEWLTDTKFDENNHNKIIKILNKVKIEIESFYTYLKYKGEPETDEAIGQSMIGKVVTIENSPESYYNFMQHLHVNNFFYSGLNIIEKEDKLKIYFY